MRSIKKKILILIIINNVVLASSDSVSFITKYTTQKPYHSLINNLKFNYLQ